MTQLSKTPTLSSPLSELRTGEGGWVEKIEGPEEIIQRFMEMGLIEEEFVEILHEAPFGKDPVAIQVRGSLLALRRQEARFISIRRVPQL
jgi:Fe2+ transport system protein FeoA